MALTDSLVSYWKLDEASGTREDSHSSNDLTSNNAVGSAAAQINIGADFEAGSSQYLSIADGSQTGLDLSSAFSFSFWIKAESLTGTSLISKFASTQLAYLLEVKADGDLELKLSDDGTENAGHFLDIITTASGHVSTSEFRHIVITADVATEAVIFYVNGSAVADSHSGSIGASLHNSTASFIIGAENGTTNFFDGIVDELGVWSRVLTSDEVTSLYNSGNGLAYPFSAASTKNLLLLGVG